MTRPGTGSPNGGLLAPKTAVGQRIFMATTHGERAPGDFLSLSVGTRTNSRRSHTPNCFGTHLPSLVVCLRSVGCRLNGKPWITWRRPGRAKTRIPMGCIVKRVYGMTSGNRSLTSIRSRLCSTTSRIRSWHSCWRTSLGDCRSVVLVETQHRSNACCARNCKRPR